MFATLVLTNPGWLAAALAVACAVAVGFRTVGRRAWVRIVAAVGVALVTGVIGVCAVLVARFGGLKAQIVLGALAAAGGLWLAVELYRREAGTVGPTRRLVLVGARVGAWLVVLTLLARPAWERVLVTWDKPILAVLLDHSTSMSIADRASTVESALQRAARAEAAVTEGAAAIERLNELCDVRLRRIGARPAPIDTWAFSATEGLTGIAAALAEAREMRSASGQPARWVLLVSDGAENASTGTAVEQVAAELAEQRTALIAVGVGPRPGQTPLIELEPLLVPPRIGARELLHVPVTGRVQACRGGTLALRIMWDDHEVASGTIGVDYDVQHFRATHDVLPPDTGAHRLTVRLTLPAELGGASFSTSAVVEVVADRVRVLYFEQVPRTEAAFVARALAGDETLEVTRQFLFDARDVEATGRAAAELWTGYDVVLLGRLRARFSTAALEALSKAVTERGVGLLLAGGRQLLASENCAGTALADISPVAFARQVGDGVTAARFVPSLAGLRHPVFQQETGADGTAQSQRRPWLELPALGGTAVLGAAKPAAVVLGDDGQGRPLLVVQEVGRGRCAVAGWESTWPWALASEEGSVLHRRLWRQLVAWLGNRRPRAWVVTDQPSYPLAALVDGETRVRVRAGVSGLAAALPSASRAGLRATLTLARTDGDGPSRQAAAVTLQRGGEEWTATIPDTLAAGVGKMAAGSYVLDFAVRVADVAGEPQSPEAQANDEFTARTRFTVVEEDVEQRTPTANLSLLRAAAERTSDCGGRYYDISALPEALSELAAKDRRQRVEERTRYSVVERDPWVLLVALVVAATAEWALRKRSGLA